MRLLLGVVLGSSLFVIVGSAGSASASANVRLDCSSSVDCKAVDCAPEGHEPGAFDIIRIENHGDVPQDLSGWELRSDPEDTEKMSLTIAGSLDPGERLAIVAGYHSQPFPGDNVFQWSILGVLREGPPMDYVKIFDSSGQLVFGRSCDGQLLAAPGTATPDPTATPAAGEATPTPAPSGQAATGGNSARAATSGQAASGSAQSSAAGQVAAAGAAAPGAPNSGIGSLAPVGAGSPCAIAWLVLCAGLFGLAAGASIIRRRVAVRRGTNEGARATDPQREHRG